MIRFEDSVLLDGLPRIFREHPWARALSRVIEKYDKRLLDWCREVLVYADPYHLSEVFCDLLAIELQTPQYRQEYTVDTKRVMVLHSFEYLALAGTKYAVERLVSDIFGDAHIEEWYEYGDDPGYFGVEINGNVPKELEDQFIETVWAVKPVSAWLRHLRFVHPMPEFAVTFTPAFFVHSQSQLPELSPPWDGSMTEYFTASKQGHYSTLQLPELLSPWDGLMVEYFSVSHRDTFSSHKLPEI